MNVSAIIVGDEILSGHVQDANTHFIAARVAHHGHRLRRVVVVGDDPEQIAAELRRELDGGAGIVFVCGGLGPTHDDRTMEAVAAALDRSLAPCEPLAAGIEELVTRLAEQGLSGTVLGVDGLRKMALAPEGAEMLRCSAGVVPAVAIADPRGTVVVLPGPPRELQMVFLDAVEHRYLEGTGTQVVREEIEHHFPESALAAALSDLAKQHPLVGIGSYPQRDRTLIRVVGPAEAASSVAQAIRARLRHLSRSEEGIRLLAYFQERRSKRSG